MGIRIERGPLARAGEWTHQYADPGKSCASSDELVQLPLKVLWFGGVGPSGMGAYHGIDGFRTFSKKKGVLLQSGLTASMLGRFIKPPYTRWSDWMIRILIGRSKR